MDVIVRYWSKKEQKMKIRYWGSSFFNHGKHQNILKQFNYITNELYHENLYQISMDGPNVNFKFQNEMVQ